MERFAVVLAALLGLAGTALSGFFWVPYLRRLKFGQTIREVGPTWHREKQGTPTMGGFMFILGSGGGVLGAACVLAGKGVLPFSEAMLLMLGVFTALAFAVIGFVDDYLKVVRKQNLGLRAGTKLAMQTLVTACFLTSLHLMGRLSTLVNLPFLGPVEFGVWFYPLSFLLIVGTVNAVNLTDGLDGLCASVSLWVTGGFLAVALALMRYPAAIWAAALAGACAGFLFWNFYPAKVFMGDTGSLFLGGGVAALGYCLGRPELVVILGLLYLLEAGSVMLQVAYFKLTKGKRIFKMTPIHHHFEMCGWSEVQIDMAFGLFAILCAALGYVYAVVLA